MGSSSYILVPADVLNTDCARALKRLYDSREKSAADIINKEVDARNKWRQSFFMKPKWNYENMKEELEGDLSLLVCKLKYYDDAEVLQSLIQISAHAIALKTIKNDHDWMVRVSGKDFSTIKSWLA